MGGMCLKLATVLMRHLLGLCRPTLGLPKTVLHWLFHHLSPHIPPVLSLCWAEIVTQYEKKVLSYVHTNFDSFLEFELCPNIVYQ